MKLILIFTMLTINAFAYQNSEQDADVNLLLYLAVEDSYNGVDLEKIESLLKKGADPNWIDKRYPIKTSVLERLMWHTSAYANEQEKKQILTAAKLLFEYGANLENDKSILYSPIVSDYYELTKVLLASGAKQAWDKRSLGGYDYDRTPIEEANARGYEDIVKLLLEYGASPLDRKEAVQGRFVTGAGQLPESLNPEELALLIKDGANVNYKYKKETALINSIERGKYSEFENAIYLLNIGANPNTIGATMGHDKTPLSSAVLETSFIFNNDGYSKETSKLLLKLLLEKEALVSKKGPRGKIPLHYAAENNNVFATKLLLTNNSKVMAKDNSGKTPLDYAESGEIIKLLKQYGARE